MLYLGKGRKGLAYLPFEIAAYFLSYYAVHLEILELPTAKILAYLTVRLVGVPHCFFVSTQLHGRRPTAWFARWYNMVGVLLVASIFVALVARPFLMEPYHIPSGAMQPTLRIGDHLFVSKFAYGYSRYSFPFSPRLFDGRVLGKLPQRGDVAVFRNPTDDRVDYIKRIVGLPGDRVQLIGGVLHINDEPVVRAKIRDLADEGGRVAGPAIEYSETLPGGRSYLIWERRGSEITDDTAEYLVPEGHVFVLGDNRDNSLDSRALNQVGYVPMENLVGRLGLVFWNSQDEKIPFLMKD